MPHLRARKPRTLEAKPAILLLPKHYQRSTYETVKLAGPPSAVSTAIDHQACSRTQVKAEKNVTAGTLHTMLFVSVLILDGHDLTFEGH